MEKFETEIGKLKDERTHIWNAFLVSLSGTLTLLTNLNTETKVILFILGLISSILLFFVYFKKDDQIELIINKMEKE